MGRKSTMLIGIGIFGFLVSLMVLSAATLGNASSELALFSASMLILSSMTMIGGYAVSVGKESTAPNGLARAPSESDWKYEVRQRRP